MIPCCFYAQTRIRYICKQERRDKQYLQYIACWRKCPFNRVKGYGKSALAGAISSYLEKNKVKTLFINCLKIIDPASLLVEANRDWEKINRKGRFKVETGLDAREILDVFFDELSKEHVRVLILDEITSLLKRFGEFSPFSSIGGAKAVAGYIKDYLDNTNLGVLASDTSIGAVYDLILDYSSPMLKSFQRVILLDPLQLTDAADLLEKFMAKLGKVVDKNIAQIAAQRLFGVPQYIIFLAYALPDNPTEKRVEETIIEELTTGTLNTYFELFFEKFPPEQRAVLYSISRGANTYTSISKQFTSINTVRALKELVKANIVKKIEKGKRKITYTIYDRVFATRLKLKDFPDLKKETVQRILLSTLSFESYIREILNSLKQSIEITDAKGEKITIPKLEKVKRLIKNNIEIDVLGIIKGNEVLIAECYFGGKAKIDKAIELEKEIKIAEKIGYKVKKPIIVSYFGFDKKLIDYAKNKKIYLIQAEQIRKLAKTANLPQI